MANKTKRRPTRKARRICINLQEDWGMALKALAKLNVRPITHEFQLALEPRLIQAGIPVPKS